MFETGWLCMHTRVWEWGQAEQWRKEEAEEETEWETKWGLWDKLLFRQLHHVHQSRPVPSPPKTETEDGAGQTLIDSRSVLCMSEYTWQPEYLKIPQVGSSHIWLNMILRPTDRTVLNAFFSDMFRNTIEKYYKLNV